MTEQTGAVEVMALASLTPYPGNPRRGDVDSIAASVAVHGQYQPLLVQRSTGYVLAGNHTRLALLSEGYTEAQVVVLDVPDNLARAIVAADNRHHDIGVYDTTLLLAALETLQAAGHLYGTGYDPDDVDDLAASLGSLPALEAQPFTGGYAESPEEYEARLAKAEGSRVADTPLRPLLLLLNAEEHTTYARLLDVLRKQWSDPSAASVVARVLHSVAASVI